VTETDWVGLGGRLAVQPNVVVSRPPRSSTFEMAERTLTSVSLQKFTELEELAEEIIEDKHQVKGYKS